jgi:hypothetical protein
LGRDQFIAAVELLRRAEVCWLRLFGFGPSSPVIHLEGDVLSRVLDDWARPAYCCSAVAVSACCRSLAGSREG